MMQEDATYMNLFVVEQFYKIFKFHFIQDGSFNLIPHIHVLPIYIIDFLQSWYYLYLFKYTKTILFVFDKSEIDSY